jgi:hypothetical protein
MKRTVLILIFLGSIYQSFAQSPSIDNLKHYRIQLDTRTNRHLVEIPKLLLEGYCKGYYKAYYPKAIFTEVNFGDFLEHYNWNEPLYNESTTCIEDDCSNPAFIELFSRFNGFIDYYEQTIYNALTGRMERKIPFLQLVYTMNYEGKDYFFKGPLFRMDELEKSIFIKNEGNDLQPQSIKYCFDLGRYYSVELSSDDIKNKEKRTNQGDDHLEH